MALYYVFLILIFTVILLYAYVYVNPKGWLYAAVVAPPFHLLI